MLQTLNYNIIYIIALDLTGFGYGSGYASNGYSQFSSNANNTSTSYRNTYYETNAAGDLEYNRGGVVSVAKIARPMGAEIATQTVMNAVTQTGKI